MGWGVVEKKVTGEQVFHCKRVPIHGCQEPRLFIYKLVSFFLLRFQYGKKKLKYFPYNHQHEYFFFGELFFLLLPYMWRGWESGACLYFLLASIAALFRHLMCIQWMRPGPLATGSISFIVVFGKTPACITECMEDSSPHLLFQGPWMHWKESPHTQLFVQRLFQTVQWMCICWSSHCTYIYMLIVHACSALNIHYFVTCSFHVSPMQE